MLHVGFKIPHCTLYRIVEGAPVGLDLHTLLPAGARHILIGMPGAFTPVCTHRHLPQILGQREALKASGFGSILVVTNDNPWALEAWRQSLGDTGGVEFLSDANEELLQKLQVHAFTPQLGLGRTYARCVLRLSGTQVEKFSIERAVVDVTCTAFGDAPDAAA